MGWCHRRGKNPAPGEEGASSKWHPGLVRYSPCQILFRYQIRTYQKEKQHNGDVASQRSGHQPIVEYSRCRWPARNRNLCRVVYPTRSVREWKFSSEFGVPRGRGVARSRTPVAVTEARTQYLAILSQPPQGGVSCLPAQTILRASAAG